MIKLGETGISKLYLGEMEISKAYFGESLVYDAGGSPTPPTPPTPVLPSGYTQLESIGNGTRSNGAYIDTGLLPNDANWRFVGSWKRTDTPTNTTASIIAALGNAQAYNRYAIIGTNDDLTELKVTAYSKGGSATTVYLSDGGTTVFHTFNLQKGSLVLDGVTISINTTSSGSVTNNMKIGSKEYPLRLGEFKAYHNNALVADLIPCKRDSDSVYGMYDIVREEFYASANSYSFTE